VTTNIIVIDALTSNCNYTAWKDDNPPAVVVGEQTSSGDSTALVTPPPTPPGTVKKGKEKRVRYWALYPCMYRNFKEALLRPSQQLVCYVGGRGGGGRNSITANFRLFEEEIHRSLKETVQWLGSR
jgi:hypothetical protein